MAYFSTPNEVSAMPGYPAPISNERIAAVLTGQNWTYETDEDGDLCGGWDGHMFYFLRMGANKEIFMVRGRWEARLPLGMGSQLLPVLNEWHLTHFFPKAVVVDFPDDGNSRVFTEVTVDCEHGISDEQLLLHINAGINSALGLFEELEKRFPGLGTAGQ
jgi:hypothetical protein